jgi:glc operon protein GlcG
MDAIVSLLQHRRPHLFRPSRKLFMKYKPVLTHSDVVRILDAARAEAQLNQWPVAIAIVDEGGHPLALERLDGAAPVSAYIATEKARTSALGRRASGGYEEMINAGRTAFLSAPLTAMLEGGVPIVVEGQVIGAVGVSGVKSTQDAQVATAGATAAPPPSLVSDEDRVIGERPSFQDLTMSSRTTLG